MFVTKQFYSKNDGIANTSVVNPDPKLLVGSGYGSGKINPDPDSPGSEMVGFEVKLLCRPD
jgi:hypothetical protein